MKIKTLLKAFLLLVPLLLSLQPAPALAAEDAVQAISDFSNDLGLGNNDDEILDPDVAFKLTTELRDANTLLARWQIADKHYLYRDKFKFKIKSGDNIQLGEAKLPPGETKNDEFFGKIKVFHNSVEATLPLLLGDDSAKTIEVQFTYQGCAEETGICYPPIRKTLSFDIPAGGKVTKLVSVTTAAETSEKTTKTTEKPGETAPTANETKTASVAPYPPLTETPTKTLKTVVTEDDYVPEQDRSLAVLASGDVLKILVYFFLGGLALAFTACMYPMIPILSSIIVGHGDNISHSKAFVISMAYVQSMSITFGILGAAVALFAGGVNLQASFQSPWVLIPFSLLFVALAFSMFGFYNIQMPASVQSWLNNFSNKQKGGSLHGAIFMGAASALIIGPCAGPVIIGALAYVAAESDPLTGFMAMFILGNGLGLPLLIVGTAGGHILPKAGSWMDTVKAAAGVVLIAIAILFLERISFISSTLIMMTWASFFIIVGVYLGAGQPIREGASGWFKLWKGLGVIFIVYGVIVMIGGLTGARNFNDPLHGSSLTMGGGTSETKHLAFKRIKSDKDLLRELAAASAAGKFVMLDFYADWCTYCKKFEDYVFSNPDVHKLLKDFVLLQADVTANDEQDIALNKMTGVQAPPAILFFNKEGKEIRNYRIVGNMDAPTFINHVKKIIANNK